MGGLCTKKYINIIRNYNINYIYRTGSKIELYDNFIQINNQYKIDKYNNRIIKIKNFCNEEKILELSVELELMLHYYKNYDKIKSVMK